MMERPLRTYHFRTVTECNMCGEPAENARVLGTRLDRSQGTRPRSRTGIAVSVCRCRSCGLIFPQPMPVPESIEDHYGVPPESYWASSYFTHDPTYFAPQIADAKRLLPFRAGAKALDVGVGIGKAAVALRDAGFDVWGVEPSEPFRQKAIEHTGLPEDRILLSSIEDAEFPSEFFDFITFGAVLEHLYDPAFCIERCLKWLVPGGLIHIEVPSADWLISALLNLYFRLAGTHYVTHLSPMHSPFHLHEFTPRSFEAHGRKAGYVIAHQYVDVASVMHVPAIMRPLLRSWMARTGRGMQLTVWLRKK